MRENTKGAVVKTKTVVVMVTIIKMSSILEAFLTTMLHHIACDVTILHHIACDVIILLEETFLSGIRQTTLFCTLVRFFISTNTTKIKYFF